MYFGEGVVGTNVGTQPLVSFQGSHTKISNFSHKIFVSLFLFRTKQHINNMYQIVIIGGGPAGVDASTTLSKLLSARNDVHITLIEKRDRYFHSIGALRAMVDTSFTKNILIPYDNVFKGASNVELKFAIVQSIDFDERSVTFQPNASSSSPNSHQEILKYDYLIMATGSSYPAPIKPANDNHKDIMAEFSKTATHIKQAERILVIGGGAVGIELAVSLI